MIFEKEISNEEVIDLIKSYCLKQYFKYIDEYLNSHNDKRLLDKANSYMEISGFCIGMGFVLDNKLAFRELVNDLADDYEKERVIEEK